MTTGIAPRAADAALRYLLAGGAVVRFNTTDTNYYNRLFSLAGLGSPGQMSGFNANYGNAGSGLIGDIGNANAAGRVGSGNAWAGAIGNIGQSALLAALLRQGSSK